VSYSVGDYLGGLFGFGPLWNNNNGTYYQDYVNGLMQPARDEMVSQNALNEASTAEQTAQQNAMYNVKGPAAGEIMARNARLQGEVGGRNLNALDEQGRVAMYNAAEKDRQENIAMQQAREQAIFGGLKMGSSLLGGGLKLLGGSGVIGSETPFLGGLMAGLGMPQHDNRELMPPDETSDTGTDEGLPTDNAPEIPAEGE
jgi:hypothetical protein